MPSETKLLDEFSMSDANLRSNPQIEQAYDKYVDARGKLNESRKLANEAYLELHNLLDVSVRQARNIEQNQAWTFTENEIGGLHIRIWSELKHRGRRKPQLPVQQVPLQPAQIQQAPVPQSKYKLTGFKRIDTLAK